jgi:hypothetical protein
MAISVCLQPINSVKLKSPFLIVKHDLTVERNLLYVTNSPHIFNLN